MCGVNLCPMRAATDVDLVHVNRSLPLLSATKLHAHFNKMNMAPDRGTMQRIVREMFIAAGFVGDTTNRRPIASTLICTDTRRIRSYKISPEADELRP